MAEHDNSYKLLFSHPEMVRDLLTGFVKEAWVEQLDFATLEKVSGSYVTEELRDREETKGRWSRDPGWSDELQNLAAALFRLEHSRGPEELLEVLGRLVEWLKAPAQTGVRRAFTVWMRRVLLPHRMPEMELPQFNDFQELHEVHTMLAERMKKWPERWRQEGREKGREEARLTTARNLIEATSLDDAAIASATGLSEERVRELRTKH